MKVDTSNTAQMYLYGGIVRKPHYAVNEYSSSIFGERGGLIWYSSDTCTIGARGVLIKTTHLRRLYFYFLLKPVMDFIFMAFPPPPAQHIFKNLKTEIIMPRIQPKTLISP